MSFGYSAGDFLLLTQLAYRTIQNARKACGAHDDLAREVSSLHIVLQRVEVEVSKPESLLNKKEDNRRRELERLGRHCEKVLKVLGQILDKYNALPDEKRSVTKLWQKVKFGNGEMLDLGKIRGELATHTHALNMFLNLLSIGSQGKVEKYMDSHGEDLREIKDSLHWVTASMQASSHEEKSILTTYAEDDKAIWKTFRRELIKEGFSCKLLDIHKSAIKKYIIELGNRGAMDELPSYYPPTKPIKEPVITDPYISNDESSESGEEVPAKPESGGERPGKQNSNLANIAEDSSKSKERTAGPDLQPRDPRPSPTSHQPPETKTASSNSSSHLGLDSDLEPRIEQGSDLHSENENEESDSDELSTSSEYTLGANTSLPQTKPAPTITRNPRSRHRISEMQGTSGFAPSSQTNSSGLPRPAFVEDVEDEDFADGTHPNCISTSEDPSRHNHRPETTRLEPENSRSNTNDLSDSSACQAPVYWSLPKFYKQQEPFRRFPTQGQARLTKETLELHLRDLGQVYDNKLPYDRTSNQNSSTGAQDGRMARKESTSSTP